MAPQLNTAPQDSSSYPPEAAELETAGPPSQRNVRFANAMTSFADMVAPRRRVIRDPFYGNVISHASSAPEDASKLSVGTWVMVVVAGITLGATLTLMSAGI
jgi:hypothetical protein